MNRPGRILVVDDTPANLKLLVDTLGAEGHEARPADSGELALASIAVSPPELVLLDIRMPGLDGFEVFRRLRARAETCEIPVIFVSAVTETAERVEGLRLGAVDFLAKPVHREELLARVATHLELSRARAVLTRQAAELQRSNVQLKGEIEERKRAENAVQKLTSKVLDASRRAGMSEVATSVLHNVGNVLNSVNVSAELLREQVRKTPVADLARVAALLQEQGGNLGAFFAEDPRGPKLPEFLGRLADRFTRLQETQLKEVTSLQQNVEHIKEIVAMQQSYARVSGVTERLHVTDLVEDALRINGGSFSRHAVQLVREFAPELPAVITEKHKVLQILVNLLSNAKHACDGAADGDKRITVRVTHSEGRLRVEVIDNGIGIPAENLERIFSNGFTTKKTGHGFGLHSAAIAAKELGGSLTVRSDGHGYGATFTLDLLVEQGVQPAASGASLATSKG